MFAENRRLIGLVSVIILAAGVPTLMAAPEACCFNPTGCLNAEPGNCLAASGFPRGPGTTCAGVDCSSLGSCCETNGGCNNMSSFICTNVGGTFHGDGTSCNDTETNCDDGVDNDCDGDTDCADNDCDSVESCTGACCNADGSCDDGESAGSCTGVFQGIGSNCFGGVSCPQPLGACCMTGGGCQELTPDDCDVMPNSGWAGPFTTCGVFFPAETGQVRCCDGYDNDCDGFTDTADTNCFGINCLQPPAVAPYPHDRRKNRYISFAPNNGPHAVAFRVQKTTTPTGSCWVQTPKTAPGSDQFTATCGSNPVFRVWNEPVIHVGDCEIIPVANYEIYANGPFENATPLTVGTILLPSVNNKKWGDNIGANNGTEWTPPNQIASVNDVLSVLAYVNQNQVRPHFTVVNLQATGSANSCLNANVNTSDVFIAVLAVSGASYGPPSTTKIADPAQCAMPPNTNCPCCGN